MDLQSVLTSQLNPEQSKAAQTTEGPVLILAGAGSGKTRVLTYRIANLIAQGEASPTEILAVTFTNKAAREMEARTYRLLEEIGVPVFEPLWISTFHSTCSRILREHIHLLEYQPFFVIYDDADQLSQIKKVLAQLDINEKVHPAKSFKSQINYAKMEALSPEMIRKKHSYYMDEQAVEVYERYEQEMKRSNALDFNDLLVKTHELFQHYPALLEEYQDKFKYIMVDEYQDTNHIQYLLVQMLAKKHRNLCVVGDEDQSIYSWRGADISNILDFEKDFPECLTVKLEENYRSTKNIVTAASEVIKNNEQRKNKTLFTSNPEGSLITVREEGTDYDEARYVVKKIEKLMVDDDHAYKDFAVFYRTNAQSRVLEDQLRSNSIPYKLVGGIKFYERMEIKDILGYMKLVLNPTDDVAFKRVVNTPARGIGKTTVEKIERAAFDNGFSYLDACLYAADNRLVHSGATKKLRQFYLMIEKLREEAVAAKPSEIYHYILDATEYVVRLKTENTAESLARVDNLEEFNNAITHFEQERGEEGTLQGFLEEMALVSDADQVDDTEDMVTLMTLHISKGLEYPNVFIVGVEEGLFPTGRSLDDSDPDAMEEERRLAYVGMTRAMKNLYMTYARTRRVWGQEQSHSPSRFISEIPKKFVTFESGVESGGFASRYGSLSNGKTSARNSYKKKTFDDSFDQEPNYEDFSTEAQEGYQKGMRVKHPTFGAGTIYTVEGRGENQKVSVMFQNQTLKKFVIKYARLEVI